MPEHGKPSPKVASDQSKIIDNHQIALQLRNVVKSYPNIVGSRNPSLKTAPHEKAVLNNGLITNRDVIPVLKSVSFTIKQGESVALTGESGSGKSTILHLVAGLDRFDSGEININAISVQDLDETGRAAMRRDIMGIIFQQFNLIPSLTVADNLSFQARIANRYDQKWRDELADRLGLTELMKRYPEQLSGGQQQRVAIGRALAGKPKLILADEPTGNLDEGSSDDVLALTRDLIAQTGASLLMVTHSVRLAEMLDRRLHLSQGQIQ